MKTKSTRSAAIKRRRGKAAFNPRDLIRQAIRARSSAHAPYSRFRVGAALRTRDGRVVTGCNVENASYGLTICAERNAVAAAVAAGHKTFSALAVVAEGTLPYPCGACRQVLAEFCGDDFPVYIATASQPGKWLALRLGELLPCRFNF